MRIAMFYYAETDTNAHGKLDRAIMRELCQDHDFTIFAMEFENPNPERIRFVRVPRIRAPACVVFVAFHLLAPLTYIVHRLRHRARFDIVHFHDVDLAFGSVAYVQFCNRAFLNRSDGIPPWRGLRPMARWLDHRLRALVEGLILRRVQHVVLPSQGVADELVRYCGAEIETKITIIPNFAPIKRLTRPASFDRSPIRAEQGFEPDDLVIVFVALGHYERKGLPLLLEALALVDESALKLLIVGGTVAAAQPHLDRAATLGLGSRVKMIETRPDIGPYLWAADLFALPSRYEAQPLVVYEAAAAGLPLLVTPVNGVIGLVEDGVDGWELRLDPDDIADKLRWCIQHRGKLQEMGVRAATKASAFDEASFGAHWRRYYASLERPAGIESADENGNLAAATGG